MFCYSEEEGTSAAILNDDIPKIIKEKRKNKIIDLQYDISLERNESFIGKTVRVLVDKSENNIAVGRTEFDSPDVDNIVRINGNVEKGSFVNIKINSANEYELIGEPS